MLPPLGVDRHATGGDSDQGGSSVEPLGLNVDSHRGHCNQRGLDTEALRLDVDTLWIQQIAIINLASHAQAILQ